MRCLLLNDSFVCIADLHCEARPDGRLPVTFAAKSDQNRRCCDAAATRPHSQPQGLWTKNSNTPKPCRFCSFSNTFVHFCCAKNRLANLINYIAYCSLLVLCNLKSLNYIRILAGVVMGVQPPYTDNAAGVERAKAKRVRSGWAVRRDVARIACRVLCGEGPLRRNSGTFGYFWSQK